MRQYDATDGEVNWRVDCFFTDGSCDARVEAEASLSSNGNILYYGNTSGEIIALRVANFATPAPTVSPTAAPMATATAAPTSAPVTAPESPAAAPPPVAPPTVVEDNGESEGAGSDNEQAGIVNGGNSSDSMDGYVIFIMAGVGGSLAVMAILCLFLARRRRKNKSTEEDRLMTKSRQWGQELETYEKACCAAEEELMEEILGPVTPTPKAPRRQRSNSATSAPKGTPSTLASITESPSDFESPARRKGDEETGVEEGFEMQIEDPETEDDNSVIVKSLDGEFAESVAGDSDSEGGGAPATVSSVVGSIVGSIMGAKPASPEQIIAAAEKAYQAENERAASPSADSAKLPLPLKSVMSYELESDNEEPGRIFAGTRKPRKVEHIPQETQAPSPKSPVLDALSVDESLYLEESTAFSTDNDKSMFSKASSFAAARSAISVDYPDDEAGRRPASPASNHISPSTSPRHSSSVQAPQILDDLSSVPIASRSATVPGKAPLATTALVRPSSPDLTKSTGVNAGASVRPSRSGAGLFTRRRGSPLVDRKGNSQSGVSATKMSKPSPDSGVQRPKDEGCDPKREQQPSTKHEPSLSDAAWGSFMNELSKAEEAFFNPQWGQTSNRDESPPPPPPPPRKSLTPPRNAWNGDENSQSLPPTPDSIPPPPPSSDGSTGGSDEVEDSYASSSASTPDRGRTSRSRFRHFFT